MDDHLRAAIAGAAAEADRIAADLEPHVGIQDAGRICAVAADLRAILARPEAGQPTDDGAPLTVAWLGCLYPLHAGDGYAVHGLLRVCNSRLGWGLYLLDAHPEARQRLHRVCGVGTRGDLRRVLAALIEGGA